MSRGRRRQRMLTRRLMAGPERENARHAKPLDATPRTLRHGLRSHYESGNIPAVH